MRLSIVSMTQVNWHFNDDQALQANMFRVWIDTLSGFAADLDQAMHQAMLAIGQEPVSLAQFAQPQDREAQLLHKIATLERQLAAKS